MLLITVLFAASRHLVFIRAPFAQQMRKQKPTDAAAAQQAAPDQQALKFVFTFVGSHRNLSLVLS